MTDELSELKAQQVQMSARLAELEARAKPPPPFDMERAVKEHIDEMHRASEARMSRASNFSREDLRAMEAATPTAMVQEIAMRDGRAPTGHSSQGVIPGSQPLSNVRTGGGGTGWAREIPLGPQPGINHIDRMMAAEDVEFRRQRMLEEAQRQALLKDQT
jgi:hypothetical protein